MRRMTDNVWFEIFKKDHNKFSKLQQELTGLG